MSNSNLPDLTEIVNQILGPYEELEISSRGIYELFNNMSNGSSIRTLADRPVDRSACDQCNLQVATVFSTACHGRCHLCPNCYKKGRRQYNRNICIKCNQRSFFRQFDKIGEPTEVNTRRAKWSTVEEYDRNRKQRLLDIKKN